MTDTNRGIGDNTQVVDYGAQLVAELEKNFGELNNTVSRLLASARELPTECNSDAELPPFISVAKQLRDLDDRIEAHREAEKAPHKARAEACDGFFFGLRERVRRRVKTGKAGAYDVIMARIDDWQQRKLRAEQARRAEELRQQQERERKAREAEAAALLAAQEAEAAAARARKPENVEAHLDRAEESKADAALHQVEALVAGDRVYDAKTATHAKPADVARTRTDEGMATMGTVGYAEIVDASKLDMAKLWPLIKDEHKAMALRTWAKLTDYKVQMEGADIGKKNRTGLR